MLAIHVVAILALSGVLVPSPEVGAASSRPVCDGGRFLLDAGAVAMLDGAMPQGISGLTIGPASETLGGALGCRRVRVRLRERRRATRVRAKWPGAPASAS